MSIKPECQHCVFWKGDERVMSALCGQHNMMSDFQHTCASFALKPELVVPEPEPVKAIWTDISDASRPSSLGAAKIELTVDTTKLQQAIQTYCEQWERSFLYGDGKGQPIGLLPAVTEEEERDLLPQLTNAFTIKMWGNLRRILADPARAREYLGDWDTPRLFTGVDFAKPGEDRMLWSRIRFLPVRGVFADDYGFAYQKYITEEVLRFSLATDTILAKKTNEDGRNGE